MSKKLYLILGIGIVILAVVAGGFILTQRIPHVPDNTLPITTPTTKPSTLEPSSTPSSITPSPVSKLNSVPYREDGTCPPGYVNYGVPLKCVTPEYMKYCETNPCPVCLAANSLIDTPSGQVPVNDLRVGMSVWTRDKSGHRISGFVTKTSKVSVPPTHQMIHLILGDRRELFISPGHSTFDGRTSGDLMVNEIYDGSRIISVDHTVYSGTSTYDILPSGETGFYWVNGILFGSTLSIK